VRRRLLTPLIALLALLLSASTTLAADGRILVYVGNAGVDEGYTRFGEAAGKPVDTLPVLPADLSPYDCIVLPINNIPFDDSQKAQLSAYVNSGGTLLALAENATFFAGSIPTMNDLAAALGAGLQVVPALLDPGFHTTTNIDPSTFTVGVASIRYAFTSEVTVEVSGGAESLVRTHDASGAEIFIGADRLGSGVFLLSGDSNVFSDNSETGYTLHDNGVLVANLCGEKGPGAPAEIILTQDEAVNDVGTQHCVTATVRDANGEPVPGVEVSFNVEGASDEPVPPADAEGTETTDAQGMATFCYNGPAFPGVDTIFAFIDENSSGSWEPGELKSNDLVKTWVLPAPTPGCEVTISNGGWIITEHQPVGHRASFGGHALVSNGDEPDVNGNQEYQDKAQPLNYHSNDVITVVCSSDRTEATMYAEGTVNGAGSFIARISVHDDGEGSGATDTYDILINNGYFSGEDRPLQGGNVQIQVHEE
jgi:hypothetical protein